MSTHALVTGAGGFIGHHLVSDLKDGMAETRVLIGAPVVREGMGTTVGDEG